MVPTTTGSAELRIVLAAGALAVMHDGRIAGGPFAGALLFDVGGVAAIAGLAGAFVFNAIRHTRLLYRAEPLPVAARRAA